MHRALLAAGVCCVGCCSLMPDARAQAQWISAKDFARCATIAPDVDRLACYDRLARNNNMEEHAPTTKVPDAPEKSFGMVKPQAAKPPEPTTMEAKVREITTDSRGVSVVQLDSDQAWTVDDGPPMLRVGDAIVIRRAALGSFLMTTPTHRVYRVHRLQ